MFELILSTIRDNLIKVKQEIISEVGFQISKDTAEIRCDILEIRRMLQEQASSRIIMQKDTRNLSFSHQPVRNVDRAE